MMKFSAPLLASLALAGCATTVQQSAPAYYKINGERIVITGTLSNASAFSAERTVTLFVDGDRVAAGVINTSPLTIVSRWNGQKLVAECTPVGGPWTGATAALVSLVADKPGIRCAVDIGPERVGVVQLDR